MMNLENLVEISSNNNQVVTDSLVVAEAFGKEHKNVLQSIKNLVAEKSAAKFFFISSYENRGKRYIKYYMNRDGFSLLVMGFTGKEALSWKLKYIEAFNEMEKKLRGQTPAIPTTYRDAIAELLAQLDKNAELENKNQELTVENTELKEEIVFLKAENSRYTSRENIGYTRTDIVNNFINKNYRVSKVKMTEPKFSDILIYDKIITENREINQEYLERDFLFWHEGPRNNSSGTCFTIRFSNEAVHDIFASYLKAVSDTYDAILELDRTELEVKKIRNLLSRCKKEDKIKQVQEALDEKMKDFSAAEEAFDTIEQRRQTILKNILR